MQDKKADFLIKLADVLSHIDDSSENIKKNAFHMEGEKQTVEY